MKRGKALLAIFSAGLLLTACGNPSEKGVEYLEKGEYDQAVEQFEQAIEKNKNTGDAWRGIGIAKWEQKDYKGARNAFRKALDNNAEKTGTIYNLIGNCDLKLGKAKEALNYYNLGLEQDDVSKKMKKEMKYNIIVAYEKMEDWESAEVKLEEYLESYPNDKAATAASLRGSHWGVALSDQDDTKESLEELKDLVSTAGAETAGMLIQNREQQHPATYVGKGKIEELKNMIWELRATGIVCDDELSPAQMKNLQDELDVKVMDRTLIILDIFAARASTSEGKIQVELAQLKYQQTRLTGWGRAMSRLGGGIGTRGPGEKKLEMDRRLIKSRIAQLNRELKDVKKHREVTREQRSRSHIPVAAIVGYTNAGKSTLLNTLTGAGILAEDKLFATLDPTTRDLKLPSGQEILMTDTVGFIRKLPHHLIEAFRSTLEEAKYADIILHVVDASNPQMDEQMYTVYETLQNLGVKDKPVITVFNKIDRMEDTWVPRDLRADYHVKISAKTGEGITGFLQSIEAVLREQKVEIEALYPYKEAGKIQKIRKYGELQEEEYREDGIFVRAFVPAELYGQVRPEGVTPNNCL